MMRRTLIFVIALSLAMTFPVASAFAWQNGGKTRDDFGTHDWVLDEAIRVAGPAASWVDTTTALLASDDPDSMYTWGYLHCYYESGLYGGAPSEVARLYYQTVQAYQASDTVRASLLLGRLSHYYSDVLNPFHSAHKGLTRPPKHGGHKNFETAVTHFTRKGQAESMLATRTPAPATDVRKMTIAAAAYSRQFYPALRASFAKNGHISVAQPAVMALTYDVLGRAVNDLADIIASVPTSDGIAATVTSINAFMSNGAPLVGHSLTAAATCLDASGQPVQGAEVDFTWKLPTGPVTLSRFSDSHGVARATRTAGVNDYGAPVVVTAVAESNGVSVSAATSYNATVHLKSGKKGLRTTVNKKHPSHGAVVKAKTAVHDSKGRHIARMKVTFAWQFSGRTVTVEALTNGKGLAYAYCNIGDAPARQRVRVTATVAAAPARAASAYFVPK
jgi:hypothetical protein